MIRALIILLLLSSCAARVTQSTNTVEKDSLTLRIVHHHDTVKIKGDSIKVVVRESVHDTVIIEKQGRAKLEIDRSKGKTTTKCKCDSIQKALDIALVDTTKFKTKITTVVRTIHETHTSGFDWFCRGIFFLLMLIITLLALRKFGILKIPFL